MIRDSSKFDMLFLRAVNGVLVLCFFVFLGDARTKVNNEGVPFAVDKEGVPKKRHANGVIRDSLKLGM